MEKVVPAPSPLRRGRTRTYPNLERETMTTKTKFHRDGTFTVWNVFTQQWERTSKPSDRVLASLPKPERKRIFAAQIKQKLVEKTGIDPSKLDVIF